MFSCKFKDTTTTTMFKFTEKHDKNHETNDKAHTHTHAPRMYTPMYYYHYYHYLPLTTTTTTAKLLLLLHNNNT